MKAKTSTLFGLSLNRAVAMALGHQIMQHNNCGQTWYTLYNGGDTSSLPDYAGDIAVAWPIIVEHGIGIGKSGYGWIAALDRADGKEFNGDAVDPIVAAMCCFVASVLGDEVELP